MIFGLSSLLKDERLFSALMIPKIEFLFRIKDLPLSCFYYAATLSLSLKITELNSSGCCYIEINVCIVQVNSCLLTMLSKSFEAVGNITRSRRNCSWLCGKETWRWHFISPSVLKCLFWNTRENVKRHVKIICKNHFTSQSEPNVII